MNSNHSLPRIRYSTYLWVLAVLLALTLISVLITYMDLGRFTILGALSIATGKSFLVLWHYMHLKHENRFYLAMIALVLLVFVAVLVFTFLDYGLK